MRETSEATPPVLRGRPGRPGTRKEDWIGEQLRRVYDEALDEAIPDEMLALLARLDGEPESAGGDEDGAAGDADDAEEERP